MVEIKCGQILSAGKSAKKITDSTGSNMNADIIIAVIDHPKLAWISGLYWPEKDEFRSAKFCYPNY